MRRLLLLLAIQLVALAAFAQVSAEYGHASSDPLETIIKTPRQTHASLSLLSGRGYEGTLGGQLVQDRLWFFGSASVLPRTTLSNFNTSLTNANTKSIDAKTTAQPVDWASVTGSFSRVNQPLTSNLGMLSQSFLSLRSTAVLSPQMTMDISVTRSNLRP